jgi:GMP synthase-like glutamine amidotransferase
MKVLIVDNVTVHLPKLISLVNKKLPSTEILIEGTRKVEREHVSSADLVLLSGGTGRSIEKNPQTYNRVVGLLEEYKRPTIGICLGAEAIAHYYGANMVQMPVRRVGNIPISFKTSTWNNFEPASVYEFHKWKIEKLPNVLTQIAFSKDGTEIFQHQKMPFFGLQFHPEVRHKKNKGHLLFAHALHQLGIQLTKEDL